MTRFYPLPPQPFHPITEAYVQRTDARLDGMFGGRPDEPLHWQSRLRRLKEGQGLRAGSEAVGLALEAYNRRIGGSPSTLRAIEALKQGAPVVVGGQQAGLFIGPAMVIYKAVSIIQSARYAQELLEEPVVPVFWIAGEDHDWDEVNHLIVPTANFKLEKLEIAKGAQARTSVSRIAVSDEELASLVDKLMNSLPDTHTKPALRAGLKSALDGAGTLSELFARFMSHLFADYGLVLLDADDPALRVLESPLIVKQLEESASLAAAYGASTDRLKDLGYKPQVELQPDSAQLFVYRDRVLQHRLHPLEAGERVLLYRTEEGFTDRRGTLKATKEQMLQLARSRPELFSSNVLSRPLMQDYLLPVLATVLGPSEIAYWAQTGQAFERLGMQMPIVIPRMSVTVVSEAIVKYLEEFGLSITAVVSELEDRRSHWLSGHEPFEINARFAALQAELDRLYEPLLADLPAISAGLVHIGQVNKRKISEQIDYLRNKSMGALQAKFDADMKRFDKLSVWLAPNGLPQERVVHVAAMLNQFGYDWLTGLFQLPFRPLGGHYAVEQLDTISGRLYHECY